MEITIFDWVVIIVVGLSALLALFRGFIREVLSLMTWLLAAFATIQFYEPVTAWILPHVGNKMVATGMASMGTFIVVLIIFSIVNAFILRFLHAGGDISILDSLLGMIFGVARGLFILSLTFLMLSVVMSEKEYPDWLKNAKTLPIVRTSAGFLAQLAPNYVNSMSELAKQGQKQGEEIEELQKKMQELDALQKTGKLPDRDAEIQENVRRMEMEQLLKKLQPETVPAGQEPVTP